MIYLPQMLSPISDVDGGTPASKENERASTGRTDLMMSMVTELTTLSEIFALHRSKIVGAPAPPYPPSSISYLSSTVTLSMEVEGATSNQLEDQVTESLRS
ncbi:hypothetical protein RND81_06G075500 [Saponaria officinalis]|uniref:Uncharacterized protein n=1 Tax=Saponaria officinalis TaxID=3572 RepID=A0AAW1K7W5_SAPOF